MTDAKGSAQCPQCGSGLNIKNDIMALQPRVILNKQYLIGRCLGSGGFGITYLGLDVVLKMRVVIKEFLPRNIARRHTDNLRVFPISDDYAEDYKYGLTKFIDEAQTLAQFNHPSIVPILFFFKENSTAYFVMRYIQGKTLEEHIKTLANGITQQELLKLMMPILDGLNAVHNAGLLHRDIKPKNIYIPDDGNPILLDFGSARDAISTKLSICLTHGYAPLEQYSSDMKLGKQGPWTDIYACAATMYSCLRGYNYEKNRMDSPVKSPDRQSGEKLSHIKDISRQRLTDDFANAIMKGLEMDIKRRPATVAEFQGLFMTQPASSTPKDDSTTGEPCMELLIIAGEFEGERLPLTRNPIIIGRDPTKAALVLSENRISSVHCEISTSKGAVYIKDLKSTFGTFLNDNKRLPSFEPTVILPGDTFSLAGCVVFQLLRKSEQTAPDRRLSTQPVEQNKTHADTEDSKTEIYLPTERLTPNTQHIQHIKTDHKPTQQPITARIKRLYNYTIDLIVVCIAALLFRAILYKTGLFNNTDGFTKEAFLFVGLYALYYTAFEFASGKSIAKFITHTRVVRADGSKPDISHIIIRSLLRIIPFEPLSFLFNKDWHDSMSKTIVVDD
ncbi:MAG: protein kinase [Nitrospirae bacterium]|nr:protein kinase [Nitrospirota bacterium]